MGNCKAAATQRKSAIDEPKGRKLHLHPKLNNFLHSILRGIEIRFVI
jgi:hypothetical protein